MKTWHASFLSGRLRLSGLVTTQQHPLLTAAITLLVLLFMLTPHAHACLWDSDTLAAEAKGLPDVVDVCIGWFDRNPPRYYEMRLERVTNEQKKTPENLALYEDAGVACARLGRADDAIAWMDRELEQLNQQDPDRSRLPDPRYRYLSNRGTFYMQRWFDHGCDREKMDDLRDGLSLLEQAIKLNPNAHFGREKYQAKFVKWILSRPTVPKIDSPKSAATQAATTQEWRMSPGEYLRTTEFLGLLDSYEHPRLREYASTETPETIQALNEAGYANAAEGISGLIVLGSAWELLDCYQSLAILMKIRGHSSLSMLATLRMRELARAGKLSMIEGAPTGKALGDVVFAQHQVSNEERIEKYFSTARAAADARTAMRDQYMNAQFDLGKHPDTDANFWANYREPAKPDLPNWTTSAESQNRDMLVILAIGGFLIAAAIIQWFRTRPIAPTGNTAR